MKELLQKISSVLKFFSEHFKGLLFVLILFLLFAPSAEEQKKVNLEKIVLNGTIMDSDDIVQKLQQAEKDNQIKGVLFVINSPGGAVAPSVEIAYALKHLREKKPVVVYAKGLLASGGYYSSIWANKIVANPGSMIGSIGVIMQGYNFHDLMQKIGISTQVVHAGKYKEIGTATRKWKGYEKAELQKVIDDTYAMFVGDVAKARDLNVSKKEQWADAHIFTAKEALAVGLVDKIGIERDAKDELIHLSGVKNPQWNQEDKFEKFIKKISAQAAVILQTYFPSIVLK